MTNGDGKCVENFTEYLQGSLQSRKEETACKASVMRW
jgi:hypothetical protein